MFFRFQVILLMKNKSTNQENIFVSEEEKTIVWTDLQSEFKKNFGDEIYTSWLKNISLLKTRL